MSRPALFTVGLCILVTSGCIGHVHAAAEVCLKEQIFSLNNNRKGLKNAGVLVFFLAVCLFCFTAPYFVVFRYNSFCSKAPGGAHSN